MAKAATRIPPGRAFPCPLPALCLPFAGPLPAFRHSWPPAAGSLPSFGDPGRPIADLCLPSADLRLLSGLFSWFSAPRILAKYGFPLVKAWFSLRQPLCDISRFWRSPGAIPAPPTSLQAPVGLSSAPFPLPPCCQPPFSRRPVPAYLFSGTVWRSKGRQGRPQAFSRENASREVNRTLRRSRAQGPCFYLKIGPRRPGAAFLLPFLCFLACRKIIENTMRRKTPKNHQSRSPGRPKFDFEVIFGSFSLTFYMFFRERPILRESAPRLGGSTIFNVLAPHVSINNSSKIDVFPRCRPGPHFSAFYVDFGVTRAILGSILAPADPRGGQQIIFFRRKST